MGPQERSLVIADGLSVVLPAHNEEPNIEAMVEQALSTLASLVPEHEVIIVDDGSLDGTRLGRAEARGRASPPATPGQPPGDAGYGAALRTGF